MADIGIGVDIDINVKGNAEAELGRIGQTFERLVEQAETRAAAVTPETREIGGRGIRHFEAKGKTPAYWKYEDEVGKGSGGSSSSRRSGGRRGRKVDPEKEMQKLQDEAVKAHTRLMIEDSRQARQKHREKQQEIRLEETNRKKALRVADDSVRATMRMKTREENKILSRQQRMGRMAGRLMGRAFWDIVQGKQGTFEALFKRGAQFAVTIISEKVGEVFIRVGENFLAKLFEGSNLLKKAGDWLEKGLQKGADFLADMLKKAAKQLLKALEKIPGVGPIIGMVGSFFKHQGGMIAHHGMMVAHNGMKVDERLILARVGEMIINPDATRSLHQKHPKAFEYLNKGMLPPGGGGTSITMEVRSSNTLEIDRYVRTKLSPVMHRSRTPFIKQ